MERKPPGLTFVPKSSWKISRQPGGLLRLGAAGGVVGVVVPVEPPDVARLSDPNLPSAGARAGGRAGRIAGRVRSGRSGRRASAGSDQTEQNTQDRCLTELSRHIATPGCT